MTLADFDGPGSPPDNVAMPVGGSTAVKDAPAPTPPPKESPEPPIGALATEDEPAPPERPADEPAKPKGDDPERTLGDSMDDPAEMARKDEAQKKEDEKKAADAAAEKAKAEGQPAPAPDRDADLKTDQGQHVHPNTRKKFEAVAAKTKAARDERDAAIARAAELEKRAQDAEEKAKNAPAPKELEEEVKTLREKVRELDISQDPILQKRYDSKIAQNNDSIINVLKTQGFGKVRKNGSDEMVDDPSAIPALIKSGLTLKTLQPIIARLEKAELVEEADAIREAVRENNRLARDKQQEVESWKGDYAKRQQERQTLTKQQHEQQERAYGERTNAAVNADREALAKDFPFINPPAAPLATDAPATVKAKQAAIEQFNAEAKAIETAVKTFSPAGVPPDKMPEFVGRFNAAAISSVLYRTQIVPRMKQELATLTARNKELEAELGKIRDAGRLSRQHSASSAEPGNNNGRPEPKSLDEAFAAPAM